MNVERNRGNATNTFDLRLADQLRGVKRGFHPRNARKKTRNKRSERNSSHESQAPANRNRAVLFPAKLIV